MDCKASNTKTVKRIGPLTATEIQSAEKTWILNCQQTTYPTEIANMTSNANRLALLRQLQLFRDDSGAI